MKIQRQNNLKFLKIKLGLLEYAMKRHEGEIKVQERWHEKLHDWERALEAYRKKEQSVQQKSPQQSTAGTTASTSAAATPVAYDSELILGQMRCLEALCEWGQLHSLASSHWNQVNSDVKNRFARMAAAAAWGLGQWSAMDEYVNFIPKETQDGSFYRSVLAIHR